MNKKSILKKYTGKGGPKWDKVKNVLGGIVGAVKDSAIGIKSGIKGGIKKYKDFVEREHQLDQEAGKIQGNVSSNQYNVDEFVKIRNKLKEKYKSK